MYCNFNKKQGENDMKKLIALLLAILMVFSFAACDKKEDSSGDDKVERKGSAERFGFFMLDTTIAKIDSLGKTEENKRLVELYVNKSNYYVSVSVYTWSNPESMYDTCETYYFYNSDSGYNQEISLAQSDGKIIAEKNFDELWLKYESTGEIDSQNRGVEWGNLTYSDVYKAVSSSSFFEIVE